MSEVIRRIVGYEEAAAYAESRGMVYLETSALNHKNVDEAFALVARRVLEAIAEGRIDPYSEFGVKVGSNNDSQGIIANKPGSISLENELKDKDKKKGCC